MPERSVGFHLGAKCTDPHPSTGRPDSSPTSPTPLVTRPPSAPTPLPSPTPTQRHAVDRLARFVVRMGLTVPAILALETMHPLSFIGSQLMHVLSPSIAVFLSPADWDALAHLLEDRGGLEVILRRIEQLDAATRAAGALPDDLPWPGDEE